MLTVRLIDQNKNIENRGYGVESSGGQGVQPNRADDDCLFCSQKPRMRSQGTVLPRLCMLVDRDAGTQYSSPKARQIARLLDHCNRALEDHTLEPVSIHHHHHHRLPLRPSCDHSGLTCFDSRPSTSSSHCGQLHDAKSPRPVQTGQSNSDDARGGAARESARRWTAI
jgi:hypothetical protein